MPIWLSDSDDVLSAKFQALTDFRSIANLLQVKPRTLGFYLHRKDNYKVFTLKKKLGGERIIAAPASRLIIIQKNLNRVLHAIYKARSPVHGFARNKSIVTNAGRHLNRTWILNIDLDNFFPTIHFGRVKGMFEGKPYNLPEEAALTLAQICCHQGALPIGAPTSPTVSNMICAQMDSQLKRLATDLACTYTRYADDITFSVKHGRFPALIVFHNPVNNRWALGEELLKVVSLNGFKINDSKTRVRRKGHRQEVTGLIVGDRVNVRRIFIRRVRAMLHAAEKWGVANAGAHFEKKYDQKQRQTKPDFLRVVRGKIEFIGAVRGRDDLIYLQLMGRYSKLDLSAKMRAVEITPTSSMKLLEMAVWLVESSNGPQGTAFAATGFDLVTADHAVDALSQASCPGASIGTQPIGRGRSNNHVDVARILVNTRILIRFKIGSAKELRVGDPIRVLGFPLYRAGNSVSIHEGKISATAAWHGVPHLIVDAGIVKGMSGGPVINSLNEVVGIAVKGQGIPKRFADDDELSRFVPIDEALRYL
jgi:RNA-directed DNA polymerase